MKFYNTKYKMEIVPKLCQKLCQNLAQFWRSFSFSYNLYYKSISSDIFDIFKFTFRYTSIICILASELLPLNQFKFRKFGYLSQDLKIGCL